jgi:uncharacterized membrane protein HdeD (DUF308 family)
MFGALGLGILLIVVGLALFFVPGIGILGIVAIVVGIILLIGAFATRGRTSSPPP